MYFKFKGKGPDRKRYEEQIKRLKLRRVAFRTMSLASEDYPLLLGKSAYCETISHVSINANPLANAQLLRCLVCNILLWIVSLKHIAPCSVCNIEELVKVNKNGLLFSTSSEIADELMVRTPSLFYFPCHFIVLIFGVRTALCTMFAI